MRRAPRAFGKVPQRRRMKAPPAPVSKAPPPGGVPSPRRLRLLRDVRAKPLGDLFALFRDLPRLTRPSLTRLVRRRFVSTANVRSRRDGARASRR